MKLLTNTEEAAKLKQEERVVFMFTTTWCGDCTFIKPFIPEIEKNFPEFTFIEVDRDQHLDFAEELSIMGIPSFVAYHNNDIVGRFISKDRKTQEQIEDFLKEVNETIAN
ncbi:thioredoxin family protein [Jeotgalibaca ciconiae]|uniref:Thioredoxin n=1 Tax=Jeotgalibaca ciconiae TaxID=2496265 RepID=A0A3Q9BL91_9LACT|nr:thioredoxin family protein [Jeotgalibaca ciconiae]AZP05021.1 thioredoxin [Jeotgalibaca ciconiae]HJB24493.1 thioredoxin family protein [Candidatus Jeotgalibaca pullicola]